MPEFLGNLWGGRLRLWEAFIYAWLPTYFAEYFFWQQWGYLIAKNSPPDWAISLLAIAVNAFVAVGVWRCAPNVEQRVWMWLARIGVVVLNLPLAGFLLLPLLTIGFYSMHFYENYQIHHDGDRDTRVMQQPSQTVPQGVTPTTAGKDTFDAAMPETQHLGEEMRQRIESYKAVLQDPSPTTDSTPNEP